METHIYIEIMSYILRTIFKKIRTFTLYKNKIEISTAREEPTYPYLRHNHNS